MKIDANDSIVEEYENAMQVAEQLGNNAPSILGFVEIGHRAGIKFRFTKMVSSITTVL